MRAVKNNLPAPSGEVVKSERPSPTTPYEDDDDLYPCPQLWTGGLSQSVGWTLNPLTKVLLCGYA
jgi:hypothetical protein